MHKKPRHRIERGYLVVTAIFLVLLGTIVYACVYQKQITEINHEIETLNYQLAKEGSYVQVPAIMADYSIYSWAITAESAAFSIAAAAQASKKKSNNNFQYAEEWLDKWFGDPDMRPYVTQVVSSYFMSNPNNN